MWSAEGSFARKQLEKHGWTDGAGLGSKEHGIKQAIKVKIKKDTAGVGHDPAKEFTHHWWDEAFNRAASSIIVETENEEVTVKTKDKKKHRKERLESAKKTLYSNFIKASLLSNGSEEAVARDREGDSDSSDEESLPKTQTLLLPEDELFRKCGGRTAHKAARHGLKLNGKLARVEEQERLLLEKYQKSKPTHTGKSHSTPSSQNGTLVSASQDTASENTAGMSMDSTENEQTESKREKKKRKKRKREEADESVFHKGTGSNSGQRDSESQLLEAAGIGTAPTAQTTAEAGLSSGNGIDVPRKKKKKAKKCKSESDNTEDIKFSDSVRNPSDDTACGISHANCDSGEATLQGGCEVDLDTQGSRKKSKKKKSKKEKDCR